MIAGGNHTSVSCREAAKGVPLVILSCCHSSNHTPSVNLAGSEEPSSLPAPPLGSRVQPPLKGLAGVAVLDGVQLLNAKLRRRIAPEGSGAVRRIPIGMHQGESVPAPCCPLWGKCRDSGKGGGVGDFELLPFIEQHPLSQPCRFRSAVKSASSPIGEPRKPFRGALGAGLKHILI